MKFLHISDLHIGKRVNEFSMLEDQAYILKKILGVVDEECPDGVLIAGDVYDKSVPSAEAVKLFDDFLFSLASRKTEVYIISGNHDSAERLSFGGRLMGASGVHLAPAYDGRVEPIIKKDEFGEVAIYLLPFIKPVHVKTFFPDEEIGSYTDAIRVAIDHMTLDPVRRNVLVAHQFVTGATRSDSEEISVGGLDNVDVSAFEGFDYVALGHIHGPQNVCGERIRYSGTPLKYSFSEKSHKKSVTIIELGENKHFDLRTVSLVPKRDMIEVEGFYEDVIKGNATEDYVRVILKDENDVPDAVAKLRVIYPNIMKLEYDNARTRHYSSVIKDEKTEERSMLENFGELYLMQNGIQMSDEQTSYLAELIERIEEGE